MSEVGILTKSVVADYCNYCNRHQEKTMPETVFYLNSEFHRKEVIDFFFQAIKQTVTN